MELRDRSSLAKEQYSSELQMRLQVMLEEKEIFSACKEALSHAIALHKNQKPRPDGPYVDHILRVTLRLVEEYGIDDPELIIAALLHDSVEEQSEKLAPRGTHENAIQVIVRRYGQRVGSIVAALSTPNKMKGTTRVARYQEYRKIVGQITQDPDAAIIKLSDFSDNALRLEEIADRGRRTRMTQKYLPVIGDFIVRLQKGDLPLAQEKTQEVIRRLQKVTQECELFLEG